MSRVDLHCHLLPGVDDGAQTIDESLEMARCAVGDGTDAVVATPHVRGDFLTDLSDLAERVAEVRAAIARAGLPLAVQQGAELGHDMVGRLSQHDLQSIAVGPPDHRWLLVETPFGGLDDGFHAATEELRDRGFGVVLAHPERAAGVLGRGAPALWREIDSGALLQVNVWSLAGGHGAEAERAAEELLRAGRVAVLASDSHPGWRAPTLSTGVVAARRAGLDAAEAERLVATAPGRLLRRGMVAQPLRPRTPALA